MYDEKNSDIGMTVGKMLRNQKVVIYPKLLMLKQRDCACIVIYLSVTTVKKYNDPTVHARIKKKVFTQKVVTKISSRLIHRTYRNRPCMV